VFLLIKLFFLKEKFGYAVIPLHLLAEYAKIVLNISSND